ncbi:MAG: tRNA (adenosine(37)-N6)-threonylcarbamoyltransferase complex ATPase subunit type 1 TsaE [Clostridia bacterium]|nr:tRNA (adenosine(37)-N6)-threonylcarbamoyltransferase complex ATPase subunit type 1 TsaE [Clostridia bacterium]
MSVFISKSPEETLKFGENYSKNLKQGAVVVLQGDMGAGKTVFCKGVAKGLGIDDEVLSPTYAYMNDYSGKLYHFDCYRLTSGAQAEALGLCDYFYAGGVCLIEWAENVRDVLPQNFKTVKIEKTGEDERKIIYD